jgi:hypothetical protein
LADNGNLIGGGSFPETHSHFAAQKNLTITAFQVSTGESGSFTADNK